MQHSALYEALLVIDYNGSLIAETSEGWYDHYLKISDRLVPAKGNLLCVDTISEIEHCAFVRIAQTPGNGSKQPRSGLLNTDFALRYSGEEFVIILPGIDHEGALKVAERIRKTIKTQCPCTVSAAAFSFLLNNYRP